MLIASIVADNDYDVVPMMLMVTILMIVLMMMLMMTTTRNLHLRGDHADCFHRGHRHLGLPCPWGKNGQFLTNAHYLDFDFVVTVNFVVYLLCFFARTAGFLFDVDTHGICQQNSATAVFDQQNYAKITHIS